MTPEKFRAIARTTYGFGWQSRVAEQYDVDRSTVLRWSRGQIPIPDTVSSSLAQRAAQHIAAAIIALVG